MRLAMVTVVCLTVAPSLAAQDHAGHMAPAPAVK